MVDLDKWASSQSRYIKIPDGSKIQAVFIKADEIDDTFNAGKTKIRYTLQMDGDEKVFDSSSGTLAQQMFSVKSGDIIEISRTGEGMQTRYNVQKVVTKKEKKEVKEDEELDFDKLDKEVK